MLTGGELPYIVFKVILAQDVVSKMVFAPGVIVIDFFSLFSPFYKWNKFFVKLRGFNVVSFIKILSGFCEFKFIIGAF